jgi:hypothetical protein
VGQAGDELLPGEQVLWEDWPYRVTSYRVIIGTSTPWSAYLDQLDNPVIRQHGDGAPLRTLLPPVLDGNNIYTTRHHRYEPKPGRSQERSLEWPACATHSPALIAITDPQAVRDLICTAQLACITRPPARPAPIPGTTNT